MPEAGVVPSAAGSTVRLGLSFGRFFRCSCWSGRGVGHGDDGGGDAGAGVRSRLAVGSRANVFRGCWAGLAAGRVPDTGSQVGIAAVPLAVVLAVLGAWAERAPEKKKEAGVPKDSASAEVTPTGSPSTARAGTRPRCATDGDPLAPAEPP